MFNFLLFKVLQLLSKSLLSNSNLQFGLGHSNYWHTFFSQFNLRRFAIYRYRNHLQTFQMAIYLTHTSKNLYNWYNKIDWNNWCGEFAWKPAIWQLNTIDKFVHIFITIKTWTYANLSRIWIIEMWLKSIKIDVIQDLRHTREFCSLLLVLFCFWFERKHWLWI